MKIRLIDPEQNVSVDYLEEQLKECRALVEAFFSARKERRREDTHSTRLKISPYVPSGIYRLGNTQKYFAAYGAVLSPRKPLFVVPMISVREVRKTMQIDDMETIGTWQEMPLIENFLPPMVDDGYRGRRFTRVGEIVHC